MTWEDKAEENERRWGSQSMEMLLLATAEEFGELVQAYLEYVYEDGDAATIQDELDDMMALGYQMDWRLNDGFDETPRCMDCGFPLDRQRHEVRDRGYGPVHGTCPVIPTGP